MRPRRVAPLAPLSTLLALLALASASLNGQGVTWSFDDVPAGRPPHGFVFAASPDARAGQWLAVRDGANGVLALAQPGGQGAQVAIADGTSFTDVSISARLRFPAGVGSAGLAWRYHDASNYYFAALDLRAQDVRIYRVVGGNRTRLEDEDELELDPAVWHTVKVEHRGMRIRVWIDGVPAARARDRTTQEPGAVGVWTSGATSTWFDDLRVDKARESEPRTR